MKVANSQAQILWNCERPLPDCNDEGEFLIPDVNIQHTQSTPAVCTHMHLCTHTHTSVHGHLFVRMWLSWIRCAHMTASVKCGFGWQRKEGLYLWSSKSLHATALRGENAKLACHGLVKMSFPYVWRAGSVFSSKKICSLAISMAPAILLFFFQQHILQLNFLLFWDEGLWWWWWWWW